MSNPVAVVLAELRLLVGYLGENANSKWWGSNFFSSSSDAFLDPVFPRTRMLARYHGVCEAAMLVHDEHIGVGSTYHLYRMPDSVERMSSNALIDAHFQQRLSDTLASTEAAEMRLSELAATDLDKVEGPVALGNYDSANLNWQLQQAASHYSRAFKASYKCYPFVRVAK